MVEVQRLRAKALSLRGALAAGGVVVVVASLTQVAGTLAAPAAVRTAKLATSTANYFPTPLPNRNAAGFNGFGIDCQTTSGVRRAKISWPSLGAGYKYLVSERRVNDAGIQTWSNTQFVDEATVTLNYGATTAVTTQVRISVVNIASGTMDANRVVSSGHVGTNIYTPSSSLTRCTDPPDYYRVENSAWENQSAWTPGAAPFTVDPGASMFTTLMDTLNADELLEPLPEGAELPDAPPEPTPATGTSGQADASPSATSAASTPQNTTSPTVPSAVPSTSGPAAATRTTAPSLATTTTGTTPTTTTLRAGVGEGPIAVGAAYARLEEVDGTPRLVVTTGAGAQVCTATLPGATGIASAAGELSVTIGGRTRDVNVSTCEIA